MSTGATGGAAGFARRAAGAALVGALLGMLLAVAAGFLIDQVARALGDPASPRLYRRFLAAGGWVWIPLWGAAIALACSMAWAGTRRRAVAAFAVAAALALLPAFFRPAILERALDPTPRTPRAKSRAILKWSYRTPATVARILDLSRDPDARVREQAVLALGVNLIVSDIENATALRPSRHASHPLRARLRDRLFEALERDSVAAVRVEAARALWRSPATFGTHPAAAETLAAVLDRAADPGAYERLTWLALDAAAGAPDARLKAAAARFAAATPDTELARVARQAARR